MTRRVATIERARAAPLTSDVKGTYVYIDLVGDDDGRDLGRRGGRFTGQLSNTAQTQTVSRHKRCCQHVQHLGTATAVPCTRTCTRHENVVVSRSFSKLVVVGHHQFYITRIVGVHRCHRSMICSVVDACLNIDTKSNVHNCHQQLKLHCTNKHAH